MASESEPLSFLFSVSSISAVQIECACFLMPSCCLYFSCRLAALAAVAAPLISLGGCRVMNFHKDFWNMDRYRDERAVDIDTRLNKNEPIVKNPF